jgi:hypothetical protein
MPDSGATYIFNGSLVVYALGRVSEVVLKIVVARSLIGLEAR